MTNLSVSFGCTSERARAGNDAIRRLASPGEMNPAQRHAPVQDQAWQVELEADTNAPQPGIKRV